MSVIIIGGINQDIKAAPRGVFIPGTSNPGKVWNSPGGVGRNIAHGLSLCGIDVSLWSLVGNDRAGEELRNATRAAGVDVEQVVQVSGAPTGSYCAIQDRNGDLAAAVSDMRIMKHMGPDFLQDRSGLLQKADLIVADTNIPRTALRQLCDLAMISATPVLFEPVSVEKARGLPLENLAAGWITPNADELQVICTVSREELFTLIASIEQKKRSASGPHICKVDVSHLMRNSRQFPPLTAADEEQQPHARRVDLLVTLGKRGLLLLSRDPHCIEKKLTDIFPPKQDRTVPGPSQDHVPGEPSPGEWSGWWFPPLPARMEDPNGAGDAFAAGFVAALLHPSLHWTVQKAIWFAQTAAVMTLESVHTVPAELSLSNILRRMDKLKLIPEHEE